MNGETLTADRVLVATGVAPSVPPIPGLEEVGYLTNESAFELEELPESLIVLGGRYPPEMAHRQPKHLFRAIYRYAPNQVHAA